MCYSLIRPLLFQLDPERAHALTLNMLDFYSKTWFSKWFMGKKFYSPLKVMGLEFPNILGIAAGLDKNAEYIDALAILGTGFIEVGTLTPRPQQGNPKPRLFRLIQEQALINRFGFNNRGVDYAIECIKKSKYKGILGINIGKNSDTTLERAINDYLFCLESVYPYASYITVNISSPNTASLRDLQFGEHFRNLLEALKNAQHNLSLKHGIYKPLVIKIAPDLNEDEIKILAQGFLNYSIDGVIATNTSVGRIGVEHLPLSVEMGGLSGKPISEKSTLVIKTLHQELKGRIPIIASGGVMSPEDVIAKLEAGASLVQLYTGLVYQGPGLIKKIGNYSPKT